MIDKQGIYDLSREEYDADPAPLPSLNATTAKVILERSPRHAWLQHPRLNPKWEREDKAKFDLGKAAHDLLLCGGESVVPLSFDDYREKEAQNARDEVLAMGKMPVLGHQFDTITAMVNAARAQLDQSEDLSSMADDGGSERTIVWQEGETWCRARVDRLPASGNIFADYKTTGASANPEQWARMCYNQGCDVQDVFYRRGLEAVTGRPWQCLFIVQETDPPYALSICALPPSALAMGQAKVNEALRIWRWCLAKNFWPGYPRETCYLEPPPWIERRWQDREIRQEQTDVLALGMKVHAPDDWQAPDFLKGKAA